MLVKLNEETLEAHLSMIKKAETEFIAIYSTSPIKKQSLNEVKNLSNFRKTIYSHYHYQISS